MRLDLFSLHLFADIVETRSIGKGAKRHNLAVSAASKRITDLEYQFGIQLLRRHARGVLPTEAGEVFYSRIKHTLGDLHQTVVEMSEYTQGSRGQVRMCSNLTAMVHCLPRDLASFAIEHPHIGVALEERSTAYTLEAIASGQADVGIIAPVTRYPPGLHYWHYSAATHVVLAPASHPLARRSSVRYSETLDHPYIGLEAGGGWDQLLSRMAAAAGSSMKVRVRVNGFEAACRMVEAGLGLTVVPEASAALHAKALQLKVLKLEEDWATVPLDVCSRDLNLIPVPARLMVRHLITSNGTKAGMKIEVEERHLRADEPVAPR